MKTFEVTIPDGYEDVEKIEVEAAFFKVEDHYLTFHKDNTRVAAFSKWVYVKEKTP